MVKSSIGREIEQLPPLAGAKIGVASTGVSKKVHDLLLVSFDDNASVAGSFTKSTACSANVSWGRANLNQGKARALIVNSGNANAFNGNAGMEAVQQVSSLCGSLLNCDPKQVFFSSTGVIGVPLPMGQVTEAVKGAASRLGQHDWLEAAQAIMTTDTYPKMVSKKAKIGGKEVVINGICKGAGMIAPNMATTLGYVFTDATISSYELQKMLDAIIPVTFNSITIDGDTSTSDTVMVFATNRVDNAQSDLTDFKAKLHEALLEMALMVVKDAEGAATKLVEIVVSGTLSWQQAHEVGLSIANSILVKCALVGGKSFNWGRIVMAVGKTGIELNKPISIWLGDALILQDNAANTDYDRDYVARCLDSDFIQIKVDLAMGNHSATVWTCDLNQEYIRLNSDYFT